MPRVRIVIADDHEGVLEDIRDLLEPEFDVIGTAGDGRQLLALVEQCRPDLIITDISMPFLSGIEAARLITERDPQAKVILLTVHRDSGMVERGLAAGVLGYVLKHMAGQELRKAIEHALDGRRYVSDLVRT